MTATTDEVRQLRRQIRDWREGRSEKNLHEVLGDAYITLFAAVMLSAMGFNAIRQLRVETTDACSSAACGDARSALPWIFALGVIGLTLVVARLLGPLMISPAEGAWLFAAPVDRRTLLRPRLVLAAVFSFAAGAVLGVIDSTIGGFGPGPAIAFTVIIAVGAWAMVMFAAVDQPHGGHISRAVTWVAGAGVWVGLVLVAVGEVPRLDPAQRFGHISVVVLLVVLILAGALMLRASAGLAAVQRDRLAASGSLMTNLSGAFAGLDPALAYDVLMSRRWRDKATVRPVRGGPGGAWALVWRDLIRLRRSLHTLIVLAACLVVPYVAATLGLGKVVTLVAVLTGFLAGLSLCSGLRVLSRTPGLIRCLPMSAPAVRAAGLAVPGVVLLIWGLATAPAIHRAMEQNWPDSITIALTVGLASITAVARWVTAKPPDYSAPLISSPAGGLPISMIGTLFRGIDVVLLLTAPLLLASPANGALISTVLAVFVLSILLNRKIRTE